jgi:hypothetical protein
MTGRALTIWLASGPAMGLALFMSPPWLRWWYFLCAIFLENGHALSPIALAWTTPSYRRQIDWLWHIMIPLLFIGVGTEAGLLASWGDQRMFQAMFIFYTLWNDYHFGMQNFGILQLYAPKHRTRNLILGLGGTILAFVCMTYPLSTTSDLGLSIIAVLTFNHWITDIWLSGKASRWGWRFSLAMMLAGCVGFLWLYPTTVEQAHYMGPFLILLGTRFGLGMAHFMYSGLPWPFSRICQMGVWRRESPILKNMLDRGRASGMGHIVATPQVAR